jgi:hypothetical protein
MIYHPCEGWEYDDFCKRERHSCSGRTSPNHTLINKRKFQGIPDRLKKYFDKPINIMWCCNEFHGMYGETKAFRAWFRDRQVFLYGRAAVKAFFDNAPMKIKERI